MPDTQAPPGNLGEAADEKRSLEEAAKRPRKPLWFLHPNLVMYMVYTIHSNSDKHRAHEPPNPIAVAAIERFKRVAAMPWEHMSEEDILLMAIEVVMISLLNDIRRRKDAHLVELSKAAEYFSIQEEAQRNSAFWVQPLMTIYKSYKGVLIPLALAATGVLGALGFSPYIPKKTAETTGIWFPTALAGLGLVLLSSAATAWYNNLSKSRVYIIRATRESDIRIRYAQERKLICETNWPMLVRAYEEYTGEKYTEPMYYDAIFSGDLDKDRLRKAQEREYAKSTLSVAIQLIVRGCKKHVLRRKITETEEMIEIDG